MILYIDCCPRHGSRTGALAAALLKKLGEYETVKAGESGLLPLDRERLAYRTALLERGDRSDPIFDYAKQFARADTIVIAAPFWDLSFPASLKIYLENIYVTGIVSEYDETGLPRGLCRATTLYYVTTAGGAFDGRYSFDYIRDLALNYFGIQNVKLLKAEGLDIKGNDPEAILQQAMTFYGLIG